jgi:uncharacterized radical SAM superfamily Fe-S cluster-containing enzyme
MDGDNPNIIQNKALVDFCSRYRYILIYEAGEPQILIAKYLGFCGIAVDAYLMDDGGNDEAGNCRGKRDKKLITVKRAAKKFDPSLCGVIISIDENQYNMIYPVLRSSGFINLYFVSEYNKRTIPYKMQPRTKDRFWLEVNLADHCNLNCQMCDHFSPVADKTFLDYDQYVRDIKRLAELTGNHIGGIMFQGGEPLLNNHLADFIRITREVFPNAFIDLFTNGILLLDWEKHFSVNIWEVFREYSVKIKLTEYPIGIDFSGIRENENKYSVLIDRIWEQDNTNKICRHMLKHPFDLHGKQDAYQFISCHQLNECSTLENGRIYICPMAAHVHHFNKCFHKNLYVSEADSIDIYKVESFEEIAEFVTHRIPFCKYCAVSKRKVEDWKQSDHYQDEWVLTPRDLNLSSHGIIFGVFASLMVRGLWGTVQKCGEIIKKKNPVKVSVDPVGTSRSKVHLINEMPNLDELDRMFAFCHNYACIKVSGNKENRKWFLKFMSICGVPIQKYKICNKDSMEIHGEKLTENGTDVFLLSNYNTRTIVSQMRPRPLEVMGFEVNLVDHCNLDCQMCDHYSHLSDKHFVNINRFEKDIIRMGQICNHKIRAVTLLGGEPTLHRDIIKCMEITRREFPDPAELIILTNGLLLPRLEKSPQGNIWEACKKYNFHIIVTVYPINFDYKVLEKKAAEYGIPIGMSSDIHAKKLTRNIKISAKHTFDLSGGVGKHCFIDCLYFNKFSVLKDGRFYMCPVAAHSGIFNKYFNKDLKLTEADSVDIYKINSLRELADFTSYPVPFCRYCDIKKWNEFKAWDHSRKEISEYV